jgi:hypothetical protein
MAAWPRSRGAIAAALGLDLRESTICFRVDAADEERGDAFDSCQFATCSFAPFKKKAGLLHKAADAAGISFTSLADPVGRPEAPG